MATLKIPNSIVSPSKLAYTGCLTDAVLLKLSLSMVTAQQDRRSCHYSALAAALEIWATSVASCM